MNKTYAAIHQDLQSQLDNHLVGGQLGPSSVQKRRRATDGLTEALDLLRGAREEVGAATRKLVGIQPENLDESAVDSGDGLANYIEYCAAVVKELAGAIAADAKLINDRF